MIGRMKGKALDRMGAAFGVIRRRYGVFSERDHYYRERIVVSLKCSPVGTTFQIMESIDAACFGLSGVSIETVLQGTATVELEHKWWSWPWMWSNRRKARQVLTYSMPAHVAWRVT